MKAVINLKQYCMHAMWPLVINLYIDTYPIFKQEAAKKAG